MKSLRITRKFKRKLLNIALFQNKKNINFGKKHFIKCL